LQIAIVISVGAPLHPPKAVTEMKRLTPEQFDLLEMLDDTSKLRRLPETSTSLASLEELGLIGPDLTLTDAGKAIVSRRTKDRFTRSVH
jgi:hypothetical protein